MAISVGSIGIGIATMAGITAVTLSLRANGAGPIAFIGCAGIVSIAILVAIGWPALIASQQYYNPPPKENTMSAITGTEPGHWHDEHGHHRMKDPRVVYGNHWKNQTGNWSDPDERAYARHLIAHESLEGIPEVQPGDSELIESLIAMMHNADDTKRAAAYLITALRHKQKADDE